MTKTDYNNKNDDSNGQSRVQRDWCGTSHKFGSSSLSCGLVCCTFHQLLQIDVDDYDAEDDDDDDDDDDDGREIRIWLICLCL